MPGHILIVEPDAANQKLLTDTLQATGYETTALRSGREALTEIERIAPNLVVTEIPVVGTMALEHTSRIWSYCGRRGIPIIAVTANAMTGDRERILSAGCDAYFAKPFALPEFLETVANMTGDAPAI